MGRFLFAQIRSAGRKRKSNGPLLLSAAGLRRSLAVESEKTYPSYFRTITQLSLHTLHTAVTGSLQGGGRLRAFVGKEGEGGKKTASCSEHFLFLTQENPGVGDKRCVESGNLRNAV